MTMLYSDSIKNLYLGRGIIHLIGVSSQSAANTFWPELMQVNTSITVYSGQQPPSCNTVINNWSSYKDSFLIHYSHVQIFQPYYFVLNAGDYITLRCQPEKRTALNSGIPNWAIFWINNFTQLDLTSSTTIPSKSFMFIPASVYTESGSVKLPVENIQSGEEYDMIDFVFAVEKTASEEFI